MAAICDGPEGAVSYHSIVIHLLFGTHPTFSETSRSLSLKIGKALVLASAQQEKCRNASLNESKAELSCRVQ